MIRSLAIVRDNCYFYPNRFVVILTLKEGGMFRRTAAVILFLSTLLICSCGKKSKTDIHVIYSGNLAGYLEPCGCAEGIVGGLSRFGSAVQDSIERWDENHLLLDAGEFVEPYSSPDDPKNRAIMRALSVIRYDAINVCSRDLIAGIEMLEWARDSLGLPLISANLIVRETGETIFPGWIVKKVGEKTIGIIGLGRVSVHDFTDSIPERLTYNNPERALQKVLNQIAQKCDLIFLLCDFTAREARGLGARIPDIDVIICTRDLLPTRRINRFGSTYVLGASRKGKKLTSLTLTQLKNDSLVCQFNSKFLNDDSGNHPEIDSIIREYRRVRKGEK